MSDAVKTTIKSIAVLLCIAVASGLLLAVCNDVFYYEAGGASDFEALIEGNWSVVEVNGEFANDNGSISQIAENGTAHVGFIVSGNGVGKSGAYTMAIIIDRATNKVAAVKTIEMGATSSGYDLSQEQLDSYVGIEIADSTAFDTVPSNALVAGATGSSKAINNAFKVVGAYYTIYYLGGSAVDPTEEYLGYLGQISTETFTKAEVDGSITISNGRLLLVAESATQVGFYVESTSDGGNVDNGAYRLAIVVDRATAQIASAKVIEEGATIPGYEVSQTTINAYVGQAITSATVFDTFEGGLIDSSSLNAGMTNTGWTQSSRTVRNAFQMVANYYFNAYMGGKHLTSLQTLAPGQTWTIVPVADATALTGSTILCLAESDQGKIGMVVSAINDGTNVNNIMNGEYIIAVVIDRATNALESAVIVKDGWVSMDMFAVPQDKVDAYVGTIIDSATVFDTFEGGLIEAEGYLNYGMTNTGWTQSSRAVRRAFQAVANCYFAEYIGG